MKKLALLMLFSSFAVAQHSATLTINGNQPTTITGNNYYRGNASGGPYTLVSGCGFTVPTTTCVDSSVTGGATYYYVATAVCKTCNPSESKYSNEVQAVIPGNQPAAPVLNQPTIAGKMVNLTWEVAKNTNVKWQEMFRLIPPATSWVQRVELNSTITSWQDKSCKSACDYKLVAVLKNGGNVQSNTVSVAVK
jgi:hypothetical protein